MHQFRSAGEPDTAHSVAAFRLIERSLRRALPSLGDFALVHVRVRGMLVGIAGTHVRGEKTRLVRALMRAHRLRLSDADSTVAHVVRSGRPLLRLDITPDAADRRASRVADLHRQLGPRSALVVPIVVRDTIAGALSLCYAESGRRYASTDVAAARRLALQIGYVLLMATEPGGFQLPRPRRPGTMVKRRTAPTQ